MKLSKIQVVIISIVVLGILLVLSFFLSNTFNIKNNLSKFPPIERPTELYSSKEECENISKYGLGCVESKCLDNYDGSSNDCVGNWDGWTPITGYVAN
jgi:hypothetical protein